jgi:hypothetical protein
LLSWLKGKGRTRGTQKEGDWGLLVGAIEKRIDQLDEFDAFLVSVGSGKGRQILEHPTAVIGRAPSAYFPDDLDVYQITCGGEEPEGISAEDASLAWISAGFQVFERKGEFSYTKGHMFRHETKDALLKAFGVIETIYGVSKNDELVICGDKELMEILANTEGVTQGKNYRFSLAG